MSLQTAKPQGLQTPDVGALIKTLFADIDDLSAVQSAGYPESVKNINKLMQSTVMECFCTHIEELFIALDEGRKLSARIAKIIGMVILRRDEKKGPEFRDLQKLLEGLLPKLEEQKDVAQKMAKRFADFKTAITKINDRIELVKDEEQKKKQKSVFNSTVFCAGHISGSILGVTVLLAPLIALPAGVAGAVLFAGGEIGRRVSNKSARKHEASIKYVQEKEVTATLCGDQAVGLMGWWTDAGNHVQDLIDMIEEDQLVTEAWGIEDVKEKFSKQNEVFGFLWHQINAARCHHRYRAYLSRRVTLLARNTEDLLIELGESTNEEM